MPKKRKAPAKPRRARGTGSIFPDKRRGGWVGKVPVGRYPNGRTQYTEVRGDTQAEVVEGMKRVRPPGPEAAVGEWADRWLASCGAQPQTLADYAHTVEKHVKPTLGHLRLRDLTAHDVESAVLKWKLGPNTARKNLRQVRTMLEAARRAKLVPENVAKDAKGPRRRKVEINPFTPGEMATILAEAGQRLPDCIFGALAGTGMRMGEALALDVPDFDPATHRVSVTKTYSRKHGLRRPKSENGIRTVRVPAAARPAFLKAIGKRTGGPLFPTADGKRRRQHNTVRGNWKVFLKRLGIAYRKPHNLRHSAATHAIAAGVPVANVARDLGDSVQTIIRTYCHAIEGRDVCGALEELYGGVTPGKRRGKK